MLATSNTQDKLQLINTNTDIKNNGNYREQSNRGSSFNDTGSSNAFQRNRIVSPIVPSFLFLFVVVFSFYHSILSAAAVNGCEFFKVSASLDMFEASGGLFKCECVHILLKPQHMINRPTKNSIFFLRTRRCKWWSALLSRLRQLPRQCN